MSALADQLSRRGELDYVTKAIRRRDDDDEDVALMPMIMERPMASGGTMIASQHVDVPSSAPKYIRDAALDIGIQEWVMDGKKKVSNPVVRRMVAKALHVQSWDGSTISTPWCAYFVNSKLETAGIPGTKSGMARSFLQWGVPVDWRSGDWKLGDIVVMWRGKKNDGVTGHVYFYLSDDKNWVYGLGGNQGDKVCIQKFPKSKVIGCRRARSILDSHTMISGGGIATNETTIHPAVDAMPDSVDNPTGGLDGVIDAAHQAQEPLQMLAAVKPVFQVLCTLITVGLTLYIVYCRYSTWKSGGR